MNVLPKEKADELKRLEDVATEKRLTYQSLEKQILSAGPFSEDAQLLIDHSSARVALAEAVKEYNAYRAELARAFSL